MGDELKRLDFSSIERSVEKALKEVDMEKIMKEATASLKAVDMEKIMSDIRSSLKDLDKEKWSDEISTAMAEAEKRAGEGPDRNEGYRPGGYKKSHGESQGGTGKSQSRTEEYRHGQDHARAEEGMDKVTKGKSERQRKCSTKWKRMV